MGKELFDSLNNGKRIAHAIKNGKEFEESKIV